MNIKKFDVYPKEDGSAADWDAAHMGGTSGLWGFGQKVTCPSRSEGFA